MCNQNRVDCRKLEIARDFCKKMKNISLPERYIDFLESQNRSLDAQKTQADYTICDKMSVSGNASIIDYLFDEGKCADICKNGNVYNICYLSYI